MEVDGDLLHGPGLDYVPWRAKALPRLHCSDAFFNSRPPHQYMRSEEHTSELQSLMRISYAVFCLKKKTTRHTNAVMAIAASNKRLRTPHRSHSRDAARQHTRSNDKQKRSSS